MRSAARRERNLRRRRRAARAPAPHPALARDGTIRALVKDRREIAILVGLVVLNSALLTILAAMAIGAWI